jgi:drug/metabolite transporter (DMT)-like permease
MIAMGPFPWFHFPTLDIALRNNASGEAAIPMRYHLVISALEFIQSLCQNLALDFAHLPLPLFLVAANSGVAFNVAIGALCLGKRFSTGQLLGVALVVAGVLLAVSSKLAAASTVPPTTSRSPKYTAGAALLVLALLAGSVLGVLRDREATRFGRHAEETFFWSNTINALLYVMVMGGSLLSTATQLHTSNLFFSSGPTGTAMATVTMRFRLAFCLFLVLAFVKRLAIFRLLALAHALSAGVAITCFKTICVVLAMARRNTLASITLWAGLLSALFGSSLFGLYCSEASVQFGVVAVDDAEDTSAGGSVAIAAEVELGVVEASRDDDDPR